MADSNYKRSFRRADGDRPQQPRDERDRRERGGRARDRDQDRSRDWDRARDRGNRTRDRDRDRDRDWDVDRDRDRDRTRRYRSRSRDRRERRRSRSRSPARDDSRAQQQRQEEPATLAEVPRKALYYEESSPHRSASPARDATFPPIRDRRIGDDSRADANDNGLGTNNTGLPTRPRVTDKQHAPTAGPAAPMSFRVGGDHSGHYGEDGRGRSRQRDDSNAMDEDGEYAGQVRDHSEEGEADDDDEVVVEDDGTMDAMQAMMGFSGFSSTKGKKVAGNNVGAVRKAKKTEYRQYMNRVGGFNRPLSPSR